MDLKIGDFSFSLWWFLILISLFIEIDWENVFCKNFKISIQSNKTPMKTTPFERVSPIFVRVKTIAQSESVGPKWGKF
ncbi:MAG: hypothetical protein CM15mP58_16750 [Burkholderiaceae bacterium]|nr:MAG: hypothetical protein CM15mP58_16750 [Burkholderiaceae bacterium]